MTDLPTKTSHPALWAEYDTTNRKLWKLQREWFGEDSNNRVGDDPGEAIGPRLVSRGMLAEIVAIVVMAALNRSDPGLSLDELTAAVHDLADIAMPKVCAVMNHHRQD